MTPDGESEVPLPEFFFVHDLAGSVSLAVAQIDRETLDYNYKYFIAQGMDLAQGGNGQVAAQ